MLLIPAVVICYASTVILAQRYAERSPLPPDPFSDHYDDYTDGYDFLDETDIYRWNVDEFPHPQNNSKFCNRLKPSYVCDPDQILKKIEADKLDSFIEQLYKETPCICSQCKPDEGGIVVGIALLKHMFQPYNEHPSRIIRNFAETLRQQWSLGNCDNDILIVVVTTDRLSFTDVGRATSPHLSREDAHRIFLEHKAKFTLGQFYEGLRDILAEYHGRTRTMRRPQSLTQNTDLGLVTGSIFGAILILGVMLCILFVLYRRYQTKKDTSQESAPDRPDSKSSNEGVSSSWRKQDIKVLFSSIKSTNRNQSAQYEPCETEEKAAAQDDFSLEEVAIDTRLAVPDDTQMTEMDESTTEMLDKELTAAVEGIAQTFQPKREYRGHETDL